MTANRPAALDFVLLEGRDRPLFDSLRVPALWIDADHVSRRLVIPVADGEIRPRASFRVFRADRACELEAACRAADRANPNGSDRVVEA